MGSDASDVRGVAERLERLDEGQREVVDRLDKLDAGQRELFDGQRRVVDRLDELVDAVTRDRAERGPYGRVALDERELLAERLARLEARVDRLEARKT